MSRRYQKRHVEAAHNMWWATLNKGLKKVNIGEDVYLYGRQKLVKNPDKEKYGSDEKILHMVIYAPERKEYHVWGEYITKFLGTDDYGNNGTVNRDGNKALEERVKIYILTSVLDDRQNWCFDLAQTPRNGKLKVIYDNGTVKNIDFEGVFHRVHRHKYDNTGDLVWTGGGAYHKDKNLSCVSPYTYINPVGYRKF